MKYYYAAYGSNLNIEQMSYRCPDSKIVGNGIINDYQLVFNTHADIIPHKNSKVPVVIWDIAPSDWKYLDMYEGFPKYYIKQEVNVGTEDGNVLCLAYVMADNKKGFKLPYLSYFNTIRKGYIDNDIDENYLTEALCYTEDKIEGVENMNE